MDRDIFQSYISKVFVNLNKNNNEIINISSSFLSSEGDVFELERRALSPNLVKTEESINELNPEISDVYPFKIVTPIDQDGSTILLSPSADSEPTASQNYYTPIYFERYDPAILQQIDKSFIELTVNSTVSEE